MAHYGQGGPTARQFWEEMRILNIWFWHRCHTWYPSSDHQKTCLSKENPYPKYLLNMLCLFVRRYCLTFLHSEQCARRCRCCSLWSTKGLNSEHTQHANVKASFWFQTISHRNNMSHRNCPFINNDNLPLPRAFFHTIVFCNRWCGMRQASGYLASVPPQSWGCSPLHC